MNTQTKLAPKFRKAHDALKAVGCPVFIRNESDGPLLCISAESADSYLWINYYPEFPGNDPYENPKIEEILKPLGLHTEWDNPGSMSIWD